MIPASCLMVQQTLKLQKILIKTSVLEYFDGLFDYLVFFDDLQF